MSPRHIVTRSPSKKKIIFLVGPTAVGKSEIATHLAKRINAEIVSCDSMQVYRNMDILTSKPDKKLLRKVPHHLLGILPPTKEYDVSRFRKDALKKISQITQKGKIPIFAGGTGLYMTVLVDGIFASPPANRKVRDAFYKQVEKYGSKYLYQRLLKADPQAAQKIHPNDLRRIIRALEVFKLTGKPISELQQQRRSLGEEFDVKLFCLNRKRGKLYQRIDQRVDRMFKLGLEKEVKRLLKHRLSRTASYAIGFRELKGYFDGQYSLEEAKRLIKRNSRMYAKRQLTWFRKDKRINWINLSERDKPKEAANLLWKKLS
ncbi:MAG: tRNA (adenosine(37)-N6)-dimethylallyltransferase MiaA [Candidatus Omnitrophica bacterium]|nr:tRNA (adenosine(37)-N6)-dimethylallyltransferase MiaA [Candidatus Omnitrophota bacterium]